MAIGAIFGGMASGIKTGSDLNDAQQRRELAIKADQRANEALQLQKEQDSRQAAIHQNTMTTFQQGQEDRARDEEVMNQVRPYMEIMTTGKVKNPETGEVMDATPADVWGAKKGIIGARLGSAKPDQVVALAEQASKYDSEGVGLALKAALGGDLATANKLFNATGSIRGNITGFERTVDEKTGVPSLYVVGTDATGKPIRQDLTPIAAAYGAKEYLDARNQPLADKKEGMAIDVAQSTITKNTAEANKDNATGEFYRGAKSDQAASAATDKLPKAKDFIQDEWFKTKDPLGNQTFDAVGHAAVLKLTALGIAQGYSGEAVADRALAVYNQAKANSGGDPAKLRAELAKLEQQASAQAEPQQKPAVNTQKPQEAPAAQPAEQAVKPKQTLQERRDERSKSNAQAISAADARREEKRKRNEEEQKAIREKRKEKIEQKKREAGAIRVANNSR